jgi:glutathione S-transferase
MQLYAHPFSSYSQKVLAALYENGTAFESRLLSPEHPEVQAEHAKLWPLKKMPVLVDGTRTVLESSIIIEYLDLHHPGATRFVPQDPEQALQVRFLDRFFDLYVMTPMQRVVFDALRPQGERNPADVRQGREQLERAFAWLEQNLGEGPWACGDAFTLADCAAAPSLFYADWVQPLRDWPRVREYRARLLARPSFARAVDEARPYRHFFPLGAPDRD